MIIAISGGIGSGKSQVSARLRALGYNVIDADEVNRELLCEAWYLQKLSAEFPQCFDNGTLNKQKLKSLIFNDEEKRKKLNGLAHPEIAARIAQRAANAGGTVFAEIPLLIESGLGKLGFNRVWVVAADRDKRITRIVKRDNVSKELASKIIDAQKEEKYVASSADLVIDNNGDLDALIAQVDSAVRELPYARQ